MVTVLHAWFKVVRNSFQFPFQLNFMKGLLVCSNRLLLLVDNRCYNNLSTYQLLYPHWHFGCHGNLTDPKIHPISSIQLHFTQKVVGELPILLHRNLITQKYCCSFFPVKIEMICESCTNIFLFQSHVNFNILSHLNLYANFALL